jgi:hypothetical protein
MGKSDDKTVSEDDENIDETLYGNDRPDNVTTKYSVTELHNVINEKHTNDEFLKEYGVSVTPNSITSILFFLNAVKEHLCSLE